MAAHACGRRRPGAVVTLVDAGARGVAALYVRAGETTDREIVPEGTFRVRFVAGEGWSTPCRRFVSGGRLEEFVGPETFATRVEGGTTYTRRLRITLHPTPSGNARTEILETDTLDPAS